MHLQRLISKYHDMSGDKLPDDLIVMVMVALCTKDLREYLWLLPRSRASLQLSESLERMLIEKAKKASKYGKIVKRTDRA